MNFSIFLLPLATALTGWLVIRLVLRLLFRNILPARQGAVAVRLGEAAGELFSIGDIVSKLQDPAALAGVMPSIETHIDAFLHTRLKEKIPVISVFIGESTIKKLKEGLMEEIETLLPEVIGQYAGNIGSQVDIAHIVTEQVNRIAPGQLEAQLKTALATELGRLQLAAAGLGLVIGLLFAGISLLLQI